MLAQKAICLLRRRDNQACVSLCLHKRGTRRLLCSQKIYDFLRCESAESERFQRAKSICSPNGERDMSPSETRYARYASVSNCLRCRAQNGGSKPPPYIYTSSLFVFPLPRWLPPGGSWRRKATEGECATLSLHIHIVRRLLPPLTRSPSLPEGG